MQCEELVESCIDMCFSEVTYMKLIIRQKDSIIAMANIRGRYVKNPGKLPFSFYFSFFSGVNHGPRVKPMFSPERLISSLTGTLELCDNWEYVPGKDDKNIDEKSIRSMKKFFKDNIVLFCLVWDEHMQDGVLEDYFKGDITFNQMLQDLDFYNEYQLNLDSIRSVQELENFCRVNDFVNLYGN